MKNAKEDAEISQERLSALRREEKQRVWKDRREANKPEWLKEKERAEEIGRLIMFIISPRSIIFYLIATIVLNIVMKALR